MGKREIGQLQLSELITTLLLSELAALPIADLNIPLAFSIVPISLLLSFEIIIPFITSRCPALKRIIDGVPSIIIKNGQLDQKELNKIRLSVDELIAELRLQNIGSISDVEYAILEENGRLSVITKANVKTVTLEDMDLTPKKRGIDHPLIIGGRISEFNLKLTGKNRVWLSNEVSRQGIKIKEVLLFTLNDDGQCNIIKKEGK